jgi:hypothetical protein
MALTWAQASSQRNQVPATRPRIGLRRANVVSKPSVARAAAWDQRPGRPLTSFEPTLPRAAVLHSPSRPTLPCTAARWCNRDRRGGGIRPSSRGRLASSVLGSISPRKSYWHTGAASKPRRATRTARRSVSIFLAMLLQRTLRRHRRRHDSSLRFWAAPVTGCWFARSVISRGVPSTHGWSAKQ